VKKALIDVKIPETYCLQTVEVFKNNSLPFV